MPKNLMKQWAKLSAGLLFTFAVLISGLGVRHSGNVQRADVGDAALINNHWVMESARPLSLRLEWTMDSLNRDRNAPIRSRVNEPDRDLRPLSSLKLFDATGLSADWKYGGQIQYRFDGIRPLGGSVGARVTSNSLRLTLSWSAPK